MYKLRALVITVDRQMQGGLDIARYVDLAMAEKLDLHTYSIRSWWMNPSVKVEP